MDLGVPFELRFFLQSFKDRFALMREPGLDIDRRAVIEAMEYKVPDDPNPVNGVRSFDCQQSNGFYRVYQPATENEVPWSLEEHLLKPLSTTKMVPVIIFFHGGSFAYHSANSFICDVFCRHLVSNCQAVVVSVNYRRSPEHRYPCPNDDGWEALQWVKTRYWLQSGNDSKVHIFLAGDNAGGNIAHHVAVRAAESNVVEILGNILVTPMFGGEKRTESELTLDGKYFVTLEYRDWHWRAYLPEGEDRDHPACNIFGPRGKSLEGIKFPKSLVAVAGLDLVQDWQLDYVRGLQRYGKDVKCIYLEGAPIGFYFLSSNEHFDRLMEEIKNFVNSNC